MKTPKEYLAEIGSIGGKKSRRKLTKKEARRIALVRWAAGAGRGAVSAFEQSGANSDNAPVSDGGGAAKQQTKKYDT